MNFELTDEQQAIVDTTRTFTEKELIPHEELVEKLEAGDLPLEDALKAFERGVGLTRECQTALEAAQARVDILMKRNGEATLQPFDAESDEEDQDA